MSVLRYLLNRCWLLGAGRGSRPDANQRPQAAERLAGRRATKVTLFYYSDPRDALIKGLAE